MDKQKIFEIYKILLTKTITDDPNLSIEEITIRTVGLSESAAHIVSVFEASCTHSPQANNEKICDALTQKSNTR